MKTPIPAPLHPQKTFAEAYCSQRQISPDDYAVSVLKASLYPAARFCYPLISRLSTSYFQADLDLIRATGRLKRSRDYAVEVLEFVHHPANSGFWRSTFDLRISTGRLGRLLRRTLRKEAALNKSGQNTAIMPEEEDDSQTSLPFSIAQPKRKNTSEERHA